MITLIKGGTIVTSTDKFKADMLIKGERIAAIGLGLDQMADEVVDARGMLLLPGGQSSRRRRNYDYRRLHTSAGRLESR